MIHAGAPHRLAAILAPTACAVLAGATSLVAVGEWIADAAAHVLAEVGAGPDPLLPWRVLPAETTVRPLMAHVVRIWECGACGAVLDGGRVL